MTWQQTPHLFPLLVSSAISAALAAYAWRHRGVSGAAGFILLTAASALWSLFYALYFQAAWLQGKVLFAALANLGAATVAVGWLVFAVQHTGRESWLHRRNLALLVAAQVGPVLLAFSNGWHHLFWTRFELARGAGWIGAQSERGPAFWVHVVVSWAIMTLTIGLLATSAGQRSALQRRQAHVLLFAAVVPWAGNVLYWMDNLRTGPEAGGFFPANPMPFLFTLSGVALAWGIFRFRLLDIVPVARDKVIEGMSDAVVVLDADNRIVDLNPAARRVIGPEADRSLGRSAGQVLAGWAAGLRPYPPSAAAHAEVRLGEGDSRRDYDLRISPLLDAQGRMTGRLLVLHDVTDRKRVEEELQQAKDAAEEASRTKSRFLANMSHELRTPLNAIIGYAELLTEEAADRRQDDLIPDLERIRDSGRGLLALIDDILDVSKIEAGKMELYLETFRVQDLVDGVADTMDPLVSRGGSELVIVRPEDCGDMHSDLTKVRQMLLNLLSNAAKFTENGTVALEFERDRGGEAGEQVVFRVRDTGIGMTQEQLGRLFQPFTQADPSTTRRYGGTGLGLTITRRFCEMLGGDIRVESEPGTGTTFTLRLPARMGAPSRQRAPAGV
jgi:signal transduction histidine kinase